ncbi:MAG: ethanolamine utilization protein EutN [Roseibacillus sp.]|nr:ethanolamine utilization protein EutN [Roseibacillus sp.]MCP4731892.1 EutN/CcmL family microcompartment protein [Roseibacillus sp.]MDP7307274.1 EutN/CcmL family microcompartment protein [Roseibacillus sp.]MDP7655144.1 EutN/CcmL family microcompartment protein [Roseibacillus sp.]HJM63018.1 EutN/CcmL family microcompartment protein [Roseibacillus sp.]
MLLCRVVGRAVATHSHASLDGFKMLLCQQEDADGKALGDPPFVAIDLFGAGVHQRVFVSTDGIGARGVVDDEHSPVRNYIQGVIDD